MLLKPRALRPGDTLGIVAPSRPVTEADPPVIDRCYHRLATLGFRVVEAPQCRLRRGHAAGSIAQRVEALHSFFASDEIAGILTFWGGWQSNQLLEYLDMSLIRDNPKPLIGFSDVTALLVGVHACTGLVTFHGPGAITFGKPELFDYTVQSFRSALIEPVAPLRFEASPVFSDNAWWQSDEGMIVRPAPNWRCFRPGSATGPLLGGNLGTLLLLHGTRWWPKLDGCILFVEEDETETPATVDRLFTHLRHIGALDRVAGLIVGRFASACGFHSDDSLEAILDDCLRGLDLPVLLDLDFGHTDPLLTFPLGVQARLDTAAGSLELLETGVNSFPDWKPGPITLTP